MRTTQRSGPGGILPTPHMAPYTPVNDVHQQKLLWAFKVPMKQRKTPDDDLEPPNYSPVPLPFSKQRMK